MLDTGQSRQPWEEQLPVNAADGFPNSTRARSGRGGRRSSRRFRKAFGVLGAGIVVAIACVAILLAIAWIQSQGAVEVVKAQAAAIRDGKVEQAYALFSSEYRSGMSLPMFRRWLRRQEPLTSIQGLRIWGRSVWKGTAILWGSFQDDLGHSYPVRYLVIRENGDWRVDSFQLRATVPNSLPNTERFNYI